MQSMQDKILEALQVAHGRVPFRVQCIESRYAFTQGTIRYQVGWETIVRLDYDFSAPNHCTIQVTTATPHGIADVPSFCAVKDPLHIAWDVLKYDDGARIAEMIRIVHAQVRAQYRVLNP